MQIRAGIEISNESDEEVEIILPVGSVVEVDASSSMQNIALSKTYKFTIPPLSTLKTLVEGVCLNRDLSGPSMAMGRFTPFRYYSDEINQDEVWKTVSKPRV